MAEETQLDNWEEEFERRRESLKRTSRQRQLEFPIGTSQYTLWIDFEIDYSPHLERVVLFWPDLPDSRESTPDPLWQLQSVGKTLQKGHELSESNRQWLAQVLGEIYHNACRSKPVWDVRASLGIAAKRGRPVITQRRDLLLALNVEFWRLHTGHTVEEAQSRVGEMYHLGEESVRRAWKSFGGSAKTIAAKLLEDDERIGLQRENAIKDYLGGLEGELWFAPRGRRLKSRK